MSARVETQKSEVEKENFREKTPLKGASSKAMSNITDKQRTFQVLQPSAVGDQLVGIHCGSTFKKTSPEMLSSSKAVVDALVQTDSDEYLWMTQDDAPLGYWKQLAEERRKALEQTLEENKSLYKKLAVMEVELKEYKEVAEEAKSLLEVLQSGDDSGFIENHNQSL